VLESDFLSARDELAEFDFLRSQPRAIRVIDEQFIG
jgi:hypothetical protein